MNFKSFMEKNDPGLASVIYDENFTLQNLHPSPVDDFIFGYMHDESSRINFDRPHISSMFDINPDTSETPANEIIRGVTPPCAEDFRTYFHGTSKDQDFLSMTSTTLQTLEPRVSHVSHGNSMWEDDQNKGFVFGIQSNFNQHIVDSNQSNMSDPISSASEDTIIAPCQSNQRMIKTDQTYAKKNKRLKKKKLCKPVKKGSNIKGQWTSEEDELLVELVKRHGPKDWTRISKKFQGRAGKQCRERWHNHLRPDIKTDGWTKEEDMILIEAHKEIGNKWCKISKKIPGRTENAIKNHWNATKRKQLLRMSKGEDEISLLLGSTTLENYIRSIITTPKPNVENPKAMEGEGVTVATSENDEVRSKFNVDDMMNLELENGRTMEPESGSASGSGSGETVDFDELMSDNWMMMQGCDEVITEETDWLEMLANGDL